MRWTVRDKENGEGPKVGDTRKVFQFLIFPTTLPVHGSPDNHKECRWLEIAEIIQEWAVDGYRGSDGGGYPVYAWVDRMFAK
jgi:hypothetical protein